ncbi:hypothetical protein C8N24_0339 [Solirubrobacter pauli]|uniref:Uncharacterized protein n=1 Tax=Solirubrobacter pauli TaxID=166793 RepID=A0A660LBX4_9ACTN|nr:hypothetical protein [Solirubrobacter pauli]RKQ90534.1 hypothetical protein C8N24_0339 [Solirubrobacter pauli]
MARALTGPRMQARLISTLGSRPGTWTNPQLCKALGLDTVAELAQLADATRAVCQEHGRPYPSNVWGIGYQISDTLAAQEALADEEETV